MLAMLLATISISRLSVVWRDSATNVGVSMIQLSDIVPHVPDLGYAHPVPKNIIINNQIVICEPINLQVGTGGNCSNACQAGFAAIMAMEGGCSVAHNSSDLVI